MTTPRPDPRRPDDPANAADRLGRLLHELGDLLEASRTLLTHATKGLGQNAAVLASGGAAGIERDLTATAERLERMAELVHAAMPSA